MLFLWLLIIDSTLAELSLLNTTSSPRNFANLFRPSQSGVYCLNSSIEIVSRKFRIFSRVNIHHLLPSKLDTSGVQL